MNDTKSAVYTAPAIAGRVATWRNNGSLPTHATVENLDGSASASISYQESDDGTNWTTITGTSATINPGTSNQQIVTSSRSMLALFASGNVKIQATIQRQVNGAPFDLGAA